MQQCVSETDSALNSQIKLRSLFVPCRLAGFRLSADWARGDRALGVWIVAIRVGANPQSRCHARRRDAAEWALENGHSAAARDDPG